MENGNMNPFVSRSKTNRSQQDTGNLQRDLPLRVMIVDDHEIFRDGLRDLINGIQGFMVVAEATSTMQALSLVRSMPIDLVFMDLSLRGEDGLDATLRLKQSVSPPFVIILSATMSNDTLMDAILAGADGYLTKDIPAADIVNLLQGFQQGALAILPAVAANVIHMLVKKSNDLTWRCDNLEAELILNDLRESKPAEISAPTMLQTGQSSATGLSLPAPPSLTPQEEKVFQLMRLGHSNKHIAAQLSISHFTVGKHVQNILRKLRAKNRTQAVSHTSFEGGEGPEND
jgi:DNA-binding NarL/FixJ family response regulator